MAIVNISKGSVDTDIHDGVQFSFSKEAASKLYLMMSDYLYSDKEYAVISELSANAWDAHKLLHKEAIPFKVQLPTSIESEFVVRDYGPGLSENDVYRFLTTYGESNKGETNDQIGFWGIGSKSPAAVTDNWSVISHHNGKRMHFEVFITDTGIPSLKKIFEGTTDESGLEVRVPVPRTNYGDWERAAARAFKHYPVLPEMNKNVHIPKHKYTHEGNGWASRNDSNYVGHSIITTMREYQLDVNKVLGTEVSSDNLRKLFGNSSIKIDLFFDVGEIDLSISREQIQYNAKSVSAIKDAMQIAYDEIVGMLKKELDAVEKNHIEFRKVAWKLYQDGFLHLLGDAIKGRHNIVNLPRDISYLKCAMVDDVKVVHGQYLKRSINSGFTCWSSHIIGVDRVWNGDKQTSDEFLTIAINRIDDVKVIINDCRDAVARVKALNTKDYNILVEKNPFGRYMKTVKASSLPKAPRKVRQPRDKQRDYYILKGRRFLRLDEKSFNGLVKTNLVSVKIEDARNADAVMNDKLRYLAGEGYKVIGYKKGTDVPDADKVLDALFKMYRDSKELKDSMDTLILSNMFEQVGESTVALIAVKYNLTSPGWDKMIAALRPAIDFYSKHHTHNVKSTSNNSHVIRKFQSICDLIGKKAGVKVGLVDLKPTIRDLEQRYPMLKFVNLGWWYSADKEQVKAIQEYISLVDKT